MSRGAWRLAAWTSAGPYFVGRDLVCMCNLLDEQNSTLRELDAPSATERIQRWDLQLEHSDRLSSDYRMRIAGSADRVRRRPEIVGDSVEGSAL